MYVLCFVDKRRSFSHRFTSTLISLSVSMNRKLSPKMKPLKVLWQIIMGPFLFSFLNTHTHLQFLSWKIATVTYVHSLKTANKANLANYFLLLSTKEQRVSISFQIPDQIRFFFATNNRLHRVYFPFYELMTNGLYIYLAGLLGFQTCAHNSTIF